MHFTLKQKILKLIMENFNCCKDLQIEIDNDRPGDNKSTLCQPYPTRLVFRLRNFFSCVKKRGSRDKKKKGEGMAKNPRSLHIAHTNDLEIQKE